MKVLLSWLREFVPVEDDPDQIATRLSLAGLNVDEVIRTGRGISGVVIGEVRAMREHPNADTLVLVRATDGTTERDIVCGVRNFVVGDRVPMALPGAQLPDGTEIARREVRGEASDGMLCSARELQITDDHSGIMILDRDAPLGKDLVSALELEDVVFDIDVPGNRPDALSVLGVARELSILYELGLIVPAPRPAEIDTDVTALASVSIADPRGCPRYLARVIEGLRIQRSPWWMRRRLMASGMRPISNVVDITNYVLMERGHPLHAFDLDKLIGATIVVRRPRRGETLTTLDGVSRAALRDDVLICDAERPVAIGGIMGGADTEVSDTTTRILLESAYFAPGRIARTARRLDLRSEASVRFEHGADVSNVPVAADRAAELLATIAGGSVARGAIDVYPRQLRRRPVRLRVARANALIGISIPAAEMAASLRALGCQVEASRTALRVTPPSWRPDIQIEENLVEEIARLHGYDRIPETLPGGGRAGGLTPEQRWRRQVRALLRGSGLSEAQTLSLLPPWFPDRIGVGPEHPFRAVARLSNPLSEEESILRPSLLPGLLLAARRNIAHGVGRVALFETGIVFSLHGAEVAEEERVAWVATGSAPGGWHTPERALDFFDGKGMLETLLRGLGITDWAVAASDGEELGHPGRSAVVLLAGTRIGSLIELHPRVAAALELPARVVIAEIALAPLLGAATEGRAPALPRFPPVLRDLALVVSETESLISVEQVIRSSGGALVDSVELFDVYRGNQIPQGTISLAFRLALRHPERTLTDADADEVMSAIQRTAADRGWTVRE